MPITFFQEDVDLPLAWNPDTTVNWLQNIVASEKGEIGELNIIFCSDEYLLEINQQYLQHDYYTDIITFQAVPNLVDGDIFISIHRVTENAVFFKVPAIHELHRVMAHGVLHMLGYNDENEQQTHEMRTKEDQYLKYLPVIS